MRSTPCPNDTLRTVKDARVPPRCRPMTTPSKIWMRSLSPSRTLTCTLTVSPDFIAGRSVSCDCSTSSMTPMFHGSFTQVDRSALLPDSVTPGDELAQDLAFLFVQLGGRQEIRAPRQRPRHGLAFAPPPNLGVIARQQHIGHLQRRSAHSTYRQFLGPCVLREVQQSPAE